MAGRPVPTIFFDAWHLISRVRCRIGLRGARMKRRAYFSSARSELQASKLLCYLPRDRFYFQGVLNQHEYLEAHWFSLHNWWNTIRPQTGAAYAPQHNADAT